MFFVTYLHLQSPRYDSLKFLLSRLLQHFLTLSIPVAPSVPGESSVESTGHTRCGTGEAGNTDELKKVLEERMRKFDDYLLQSLPRNLSDRETLMECGYSQKLWDDVSIIICICIKNTIY